MKQETRPYIQHTWLELEQHAETRFGEIAHLQEVLSELKYRKSKKAVALYQRLAARIAELSEAQVHKFKWPTTAILDDSARALKIVHFDYEEGLLKFMGYAVGQLGAYRTRRRQVLDYVFNERVPKVQSYEYMAEWGEPKSSTRLKKLANSLATFARNAKRKRTADMDHAIQEWEEDLDYLKKTYFDSNAQFSWPESQ